jgi:glycosyltransferase involved in cell wall biosynthesis
MRIPLAAKLRRLRACWLWDFDEPPRWHPHWTEAFEEVWAPTRFVADALRELDVPVRLVPPPLLFGTEAKEPFERPPGETDVLLAILDLGGDLERQDPFGLVELARGLGAAGLEGFEIHCLLLRSDRNPALAEELETAARSLPLRLHREPTSRARVEEWLSRVAGFVSLDRGLGLPLGAILAAGAGVPIVATAYGGALDLLDEDSGYPVSWREHRRPSARVAGPSSREAVPDLSHAVARVAELLRDRSGARTKAAEARRRALERFGGVPEPVLAELQASRPGERG